MGKRIHGSSRSPIKAGWEYLFVAIDDHARIGFTDMYPNETKASAAQFLQNTVAYFRALGVRPRRILTDNGSSFRSKEFAETCRDLKLKHSFTRPYRPQTNGKAERFIQSALREWPTAFPTTIPRSAPPCSSAGHITTTGIAHIKASRASRRLVDCLSPKTTS